MQRFTTYRARNTGRQTDIPPDATPFNFAINQEWFERVEALELYSDYLADYNMHNDPLGFGTNKIQNDQNDAE